MKASFIEIEIENEKWITISTQRVKGSKGQRKSTRSSL
jgi:hypothetical protein